jgi:hypothetical protein
MNHLVARNSNANSKSKNWPALQQRYFLYSLALSCAGGRALWNSLTLAQKIAQSQPMPRVGNFQPRNCDGGEVIPPYEDEDFEFQGIEFGGAPSSNPDFLDLQYHFDPETDEIVFDGDTKAHSDDRYFVNDVWVWPIAGHRVHAMLPGLVQKFRPDPSLPQEKWWDDPVQNAMQTIRYI